MPIVNSNLTSSDTLAWLSSYYSLCTTESIIARKKTSKRITFACVTQGTGHCDKGRFLRASFNDKYKVGGGQLPQQDCLQV